MNEKIKDEIFNKDEQSIDQEQNQQVFDILYDNYHCV